MNATTQPSARAASAVHFATVLLGAVVALTTVGCKSDAERDCDKRAASGAAQADDTACVTEVQQTLDACENKEKAVACCSDLRPGDVEAALACRAICDDDAGQLLAMADEVKKHEAEKEA